MPTFDTPNTQTTWTVPDDVSEIAFELQGAGGGAASHPRQPGGFATGEYAVSGGSDITVYVGEGGEDGSTSEFGSGGGGGRSPLANGGGGDAGFQATGGGGGGATAIEAPDGTLIAAADAAGGSAVDGKSNPDTTPVAGGGGARGGQGGSDGAGDAEGSGFGGDGGYTNNTTNNPSNPGDPGGAEVASGVTNATTTTGGGSTGDGVVTLAAPLTWNGSTVTARSETDSTLRVTWTDDSSVDTYTVEYREAGTSAWVTAASLAGAGSEYTITGLTQGTEYDVRVTAATAIESTTSPIRTATTLLPAPTDLQATGTTATSLSVAWTRHHTTGQTRVECKPTDAAQWGAAAPGGAETAVDNATESATLTDLRNAERYDVRAVAVTADAASVDYDPDVTTGETLTVAAGETVEVDKPHENSGVVDVAGVLQPSDSQ